MWTARSTRRRWRGGHWGKARDQGKRRLEVSVPADENGDPDRIDRRGCESQRQDHAPADPRAVAERGLIREIETFHSAKRPTER